MAKTEFSKGFLNVDLELYSRRPLNLFATALGETVDVLYVGKQGSRHLAAVELAGSGWQRQPDPIIMGLVKLIKRLPKEARVLWDSASERRFDIGCDVPSGSNTLALALRSTTVAAIAEVNATVAITIYPKSKSKRKPRSAAQRQPQ